MESKLISFATAIIPLGGFIVVALIVFAIIFKDLSNDENVRDLFKKK